MPTYAAPGVYVEEMPSAQKSLTPAPTAIAAFVGFTERAPNDDPSDPEGTRPRLVTSWTQFEELYGSFTPGAMLPLSVYGFFQNGGTIAYIVRIPNTEPADAPSTASLPAADRALGSPVHVESLEQGAPLQVVVRTVDADADGPAPFDLDIVGPDGTTIESFTNLTLDDSERNVATVVNAASHTVRVRVDLADAVDLSSLLEVMRPGTYPLVAPAPHPVPVSPKRFAGSESARTGINGLTIADDVTMVIVPDLVTAATRPDGTIDLAMWKAVQTALIGHCERQGNRMAILDAPPGMTPSRCASGAATSPCTTRPSRPCTTRGSEWRTPSAPTARARCSSRRAVTSPGCGRGPTTPVACGRPRPTTPSAGAWTSSAPSRRTSRHS